jgi:hypothetical protein
MTTVESIGVCPQCGYDNAFNIINPHTLEEQTSCPCCGRYERYTLVRNKKDGSPKLRKNGNPVFRHTIHTGYGAWAVEDGDGIAFGGYFVHSMDEERITKFKQTADNYGHKILFLSTFMDKLEILINEDFLEVISEGYPTEPGADQTQIFDDYLEKYLTDQDMEL